MTDRPVVWPEFLHENYDDSSFAYKDSILLRCETLITEVMKELKSAYPEVSDENLKKNAVALVMQELLALQYQHYPLSQTAMVAELMECLPQMHDFRLEFVGDIQRITRENDYEELPRWKQWIIKNLINRKKV